MLAEPLTVALESPRYAEHGVNNVGLEYAVKTTSSASIFQTFYILILPIIRNVIIIIIIIYYIILYYTILYYIILYYIILYYIILYYIILILIYCCYCCYCNNKVDMDLQ